MAFLQIANKENELILNTPNRLEILKEGPPTNQSKTNLLGRGAYGTVIKAIYKGKAGHKSCGSFELIKDFNLINIHPAKPVAVKIIKNLEQDGKNDIILGEANVLGWLHSNIVRIFKIETTPNFSIVVMERFNGQCLQKVLDTIQLPLMHRVFIALDILSGLNYCHKRFLLHLDIKPQNIMVQMIYPKPQEKLIANKWCRNYKCKLCDFGSSIKISKENPQAIGLAKGTLRYMAPEVLKDELLTAAADVYSFGITLWQMSYRLMPYYWLECNEVVAYQVVKHKLRPNALQSNIQEIKKNLNNFHNNCLCETNSTNLSQNSLENLRNILNTTKCELITEENSSLEYPLKKIETKRTPFQDFNNIANMNQQKLKVKRDLQQDFMLIDTFSLKNVFKDGAEASGSSKQNEQMYEEIFRSCWHNDFTQRPTTRELLKDFKQFM